VIWGSLVALSVVVSLFALIAFVDDLDSVGKGEYTLAMAFQHMALTLPGQAFFLFPLAAVVGTLVGLGVLASSSELTVIRVSGLSSARISLAVMKAGLLLAVLSMLIGEFVAPYAERLAQQRRSVAMTDQLSLNANYGFWVRDGKSFINIRRVLPDNRMGNVTIYEFDLDNRLRVATYAEQAIFTDGEWILEGIRQSEILEDRVVKRVIRRAIWESLFQPDLFNVVAVKPETLSAMGLYRYLDYLEKNQLSTARLELAFWKKLIYPLATLVMIFVALPMLLGRLRSVGVGQRILVGSLIGIAFHVVNQVSGDLGLVYAFSPLWSALLPTLLFLGIGIVTLRRLA
jgi:lipopolysaccharide export system permease protein